MKKRKYFRSGFTLIELLVVISIIGMLSSIVLSSLNSARGKARDAKRREDLHQVFNALVLYYSDHGNYPAGTSFSVWNATDWHNVIQSNPLDPLADTWRLNNALVGGGYIKNLPSEPINREGGGGNYLGDNVPVDEGYVYFSDGNTFILGTNLENGGGPTLSMGQLLSDPITHFTDTECL